MQAKYHNGFCLDHDGAVEQNSSCGVKFLRIFTDDPQRIDREMQERGMDGEIVLSPSFLLEGKLKTLKLHFPVMIYVDPLQQSEEEMEKISLSGLGVVIPLFDNLRGTGLLNAEYGISPAKFLENMGFLDRECVILGGMYADKDDLQVLGDYSAKVVLCPTYYSRKGATFANVVLMQKQGVRVSMGTFDEKVDLLKQGEMLYLTTLSLLENSSAISEEEIERILQGEMK